MNYQPPFLTRHQAITDMSVFARRLLLMQFGLYLIITFFTVGLVLVVSGDSTITEKINTSRPSTQSESVKR